jgi:demethylmenaquinone methyltransferase/2-methoxy-6-polyprenyl-1,4-benzoquinol methylase
MIRELLDEQIAYYRARAEEYDEWFFRRGRYDRGEDFLRAWFLEVAAVESALRALRPYGDVLELACGTGLWTRHLVDSASSVTAVDASAEVIEINRHRVASSAVRYVQADLFSWQPTERYDFVFFGFWLSHVPPTHFDSFWSTVRSCLKPGGAAFFVDNTTSTSDQPRPPDAEDYVVERELNDERRFRIVKVFHQPEALEAKLSALGWQGSVRATGEFFLHGHVRSA